MFSVLSAGLPRRRQRLCKLTKTFCRLSVGPVLVVAFATLTVGQPSYAQPAEDESAPIRVLHRPLDSKSLPPMGNPMRLEVELVNTFDITSTLRLIGAKDGRFIDIAFPRGALNAADRPTFQIEIPSPIAAMTYQFVVHQRDGSLSSSDKFTIKRDCIQNFKVAVPEDAPNADFRREVSSLVSQAKTLERDTASLEASLKLVEDIKASLSN